MKLRVADRMEGLGNNAIREIFKKAQKPGMVSFAVGMPGEEFFPSASIARITHEVLERDGGTILQYGPTEGYPALRQSVADWLGTTGIDTRADDVFIVSGAQQGIELVCKAFLNPGDTVLVENPTYLAALHIMKTYQADPVPVITDHDGINLADLEKKILTLSPKLLYLVPTFQNPSGNTLGLEKRKEILRLCQRHGVKILEDDPYRELRYQGEPLPPIKSFDTKGSVIHLSSFSKLICPGLRVGAVVAEPDVMKCLVIGKQATDVHTCSLSQAIVDRFLREGALPPHIKTICNAYSQKLEEMLSTLDKTFPGAYRYTRPQGGLFIWLELPEHIDTMKMLETAIEHNVAYIPGRDFHAGKIVKNTLRLNFTKPDNEEIHRGIITLKHVIDTVS